MVPGQPPGGLRELRVSLKRHHPTYRKESPNALIFRTGKVFLTATLATYYLLVAFTNITDYATNFRFVEHVLSMDSIPLDPRVQWRAIHSTTIHHLFYWIIILWEFIAGSCCAIGAARLAASLYPRQRFEAAKTLPIAGLWLGLLLWAFAFITVGGEWFLMWESNVWNGESAAFRMFTVNAVALLFLHLPETWSGPNVDAK
jgi:predicted small integral membrane protein